MSLICCYECVDDLIILVVCMFCPYTLHICVPFNVLIVFHFFSVMIDLYIAVNVPYLLL